MADIRCNVMNCENNSYGTCYSCGVKIGGKHAYDKVETCCDSFIEQSGASNNSLCGSSTPAYSISCDATHCKNNTGGNCMLNLINVGSTTNATSCKETECLNFQRSN